ncbi:hypothetical protein ACHWQZ_G015444 [Mnemiopsis leidyi]
MNLSNRLLFKQIVLAVCLLVRVHAADYTDAYTHVPGQCILQNSCGSSLPCAQNTSDPITPDEDHIALLNTACPMYATEESVCCAKDQLQDFIKQLDVVKNIIGGCEACYWDFQAIECAFFCDINQHQFIQITNATLNATDSKTTVFGVRYFITRDAAKRIYNACKNVRDSISGGIGIVYVCGSADCDQDTFYLKLGDNAYTQLKIEFVIADTSTVDYVKPYTDKDIYDCQDTVNGKTCNCLDCEEKICPIIVEEDTTVNWHYTLPIGLALCLVWMVVVLVLTFRHKSKRASNNTDTIEIKSVGAGGLDNKAAELNSPVSIHETSNGQNDNRTSPSNGTSPTRPNNVPLSPSLSVASTISPLPNSPSEYENKSLITRKDPLHQFWLRLGPRIGEAWSNIVYDYWYLVLLACFILTALCCGGWYNFRITTDPVELWTSEDSVSRMQKIDYDSQFGTTYRTCQLVVKEKSPSTFGVNSKIVNGVFNPEFLKQVYDMMVEIESLNVGDVTYSDLCYKPLGEFNKTHPKEDCATLSVFQWLDNDRSLLDNPAEYIKRMELCAEATALPECLASFRGPSATNIVLGGYDAVKLNYMDSTTLPVTFALDGSAAKLDDILKWETAMKEYLLEQIGRRPDLKIAFSTDRALEDEIDRASHADIFTIVLSYILMFVYVGVTLGDMDCSVKGCLLNSKALLGVGGVVIVLVSVVSALGATSYAGLPTTLIVIEVIPFLILAVGVDNVYIMVQGIQRIICEKIEREETLNSSAIRGMLSSMMRDVFPSMILSSLCQMVAFALGSLSFMPSVQNFAYNATIALLMNFILQTSVFLILIRVDLLRQLSGRLDILCCMKAKLNKPDRGPVKWFIEEFWARYLLLNKWIPAFILIFFGCFTIGNVMLIPDLKLGLEPTMALPSDSYLLDYYHIAYTDYRIGPGVSFVFKSRDGTPLDVYEDNTYGELISNQNSLLKTIRKYGESPSYQYIIGEGSSFIKYFSDSWLDSEPCCWNDGDEFCPSIKDRSGCSVCPQTNITTDTKYQYLQWFISDIPRTDGSGCSKGGAVSYANSAKFSPSNRSVLSGRFTSSHGVLATSHSFITARQQALLIAEEVNSNSMVIQVYAYSSFYPYYEQYDTIVRECAVNLAVTIVATFLVALVMLGFQVYAALCVMLSVTMCAADMLGSMVYLNIPLNAISLVNLLLSVGIAVEFSANIVQAYTTSKEVGRTNKARHALRKTGPAIVSGIAMTNFVGVIVLAAAKSQLFVVFYFRMFFTINVLCVAHTIIFLPAFLAFLGD